MSTKGRRDFLKTIATGAAALPASGAQPASAPPQTPEQPAATASPAGRTVAYPRRFTGRQLAMLAFPLGGVAAGSISLGGRGQLRDWEIFNKPDKGNAPQYAIPSIWVRTAGKAVARVLEARYLPPYEGQNGLGSNNAPGLARLAAATFIGEYPLARIEFRDRALPVRVSLEAFSPFVPHNADDSGLPATILRYRVTNPGSTPADVSVAWSIENPVGAASVSASQRGAAEARVNEFRKSPRLAGLMMTNPSLASNHDLSGSFALGVLDGAGGKLTHLRGWPRGRWWNSPMLFWDDFSADGELGPEAAEMGAVGSLCLKRTIAAGQSADYSFLLAWHFPNRTPQRCGWRAPKGDEHTVIGNFYSTRFRDAWAAAEYTAQNLEKLERKTKLFAASLRETTLPAAVIEAASANLSTLATTTCFRTADGEFHGFEGVNDKSGCCHGNCTHVWNYETATAHLFPSLAQSLRRASFGYSLDDAGAMHFRQSLPDGKERSGFAAADGQMGQILHAYLDWILSGDEQWLRQIWPRIRKAIEFSWVSGGWDADRDGVMEGVQHNTYDVEFYGPNPQCGVYYLAALRACEEMAKSLGETAAATEYRRLYENGRQWIDAHLFNGEFYVQQVKGYRNDQIAPALRSSMGSDDTEKPDYQVGQGCLVDQLVGQYLAEVCGLGPLLNEAHIEKTLGSIYRYNGKRSLFEHNSVQRIFAVNDEAALVICDYAKAERPHIPFPYYAEVMTGFEYSAAVHMLFAGMIREGTECIRNIRLRYDGERRNPWDEAECGHHYARAMAAWSGILALSGFRYHGGELRLTVLPKSRLGTFRSFWSNATGWGTFTRTATSLALKVHSGELKLKSCAVAVAPGTTSAMLTGAKLAHTSERKGGTLVFQFEDTVTVAESGQLELRVSG